MLYSNQSLIKILLVLLFFSNQALAQNDHPLAPAQFPEELVLKNLPVKPSGKLSSIIYDLNRSIALLPLAQQTDENLQRAYPEFTFKDGMINLDVVTRTTTDELEKDLAKIGFKTTAIFGKFISGKLPFDQLGELENISSLQTARPVYKPILKSTGIVSQGDTAMSTQLSRSTYNIDGSGIKIGLLSDSYNTLNGANAGIAAGELPGPGNPNGYTTPITVLREYSSTGSDECRAMAEIVHDVAPAAQLFCRTVFEGEADFAQGILDLESNGCDVIVDDVGYFAEPFFQDGIIAQAVDSVASKGVVYLSAAGNSGRKSYESTEFTDSGADLSGGDMHDFDPGAGIDYTQSLTIPNGVTLHITLQWDDPFGSLPNSIGGADTDMDIYLFNSSSSLIAIGYDSNISTGDPYEIISYTNNTGSNMTAHLAIVHYAGPAPGFMKYVCWTNSVSIDEYDTESATLVGHPNAAGAIAVGAAAFYNTPAYGASPAAVNNFSSAGGTPIFFDKVGNRIATTYRQKPEIVGPDGTNTSFFGTDIAQDSDSHPNFFGTSASAPHVAGAAGLMLESRPSSTNTEILNALTSTAEDMDDPATGGGDTGFDYGTGNGFVKINDAIAALAALPVELVDFRAERKPDNTAKVSWKTASEYNNRGFQLMQRNEMNDYEKVAWIDASTQQNNLNNYEVLLPLMSGINYFKLLQEDYDGHITDHGIVSIQSLDKQQEGWIWQDGPQKSLAIIANKNQTATISLFDSTGKLVKSWEKTVLTKGRNNHDLSTAELSRGTYFYQIVFDDSYYQSTVQGRFIN